MDQFTPHSWYHPDVHVHPLILKLTDSDRGSVDATLKSLIPAGRNELLHVSSVFVVEGLGVVMFTFDISYGFARSSVYLSSGCIWKVKEAGRYGGLKFWTGRMEG